MNQPAPHTTMRLRAMTPDDRSEVAELIAVSLNHWYAIHGRGKPCRNPQYCEAFFDVYQSLDPGCSVVAQNTRTGRLMATCFYHPRPHHVSLGILNVHPNHFGCGAGRAVLDYVIAFAKSENKPLRLTQSAINLDSFSLYSRAGFVPRQAFQDMQIAVPAAGLPFTPPDQHLVRDATLDDIPALAALEFSIASITREPDYRYLIQNPDQLFHASVYQSPDGQIQGFLASSSHPMMNMLGPGFMKTPDHAAALIAHHLNRHPGRAPIFLLPVDSPDLVQLMYRWGARNTELHLCQVLGDFKPFSGISMPSFLPETG